MVPMQMVMDRVMEALSGKPVGQPWTGEGSAIVVPCSDETIEIFPSAAGIRVARKHACGEISWSLEPTFDAAMDAARRLVDEINP